MSFSCSIRIVDEDGYPVSYKEVYIDFGFVGPGWASESSHTDDDGWAEFEFEIDDSSLHVKKIYAGGEEVGSDFALDDGDSLSFTMER